MRIEPLKDLKIGYRIRCAKFGYTEDYEVVLPTEKNMTIIVEKINEIIEKLNTGGGK